MANPSPRPSPAPEIPSAPSLSPIERLKQKFDALPKTHRLAIIGGTSFIALLSAFALILNLSNDEQSFQSKPLALPSPSPLVATRFADHPTVRASEATLQAVEASLDAQKITDTPLLPPPLDMEVSLNP